MIKCAYFTCDEFVDTEDYDECVFIFCHTHLAFLDKMIEIDQDNGDVLALLMYCFSSLNNKNRETFIQ